MMLSLLRAQNNRHVDVSDREKIHKDPKNKYILWAFLAFFGTFITVDAFFVYKAVTTQTGVVTERPYEKGLAYNKVLIEAKNQPDILQKAAFEDGVLSWVLSNKDGTPIEHAVVHARIVRPVQGGYDFDVTLAHVGGGTYEAQPTFAMKGQWHAHLKAVWDEKTYRTKFEFLTP
jgi:nitrogen fixation protein FixH